MDPSRFGKDSGPQARPKAGVTQVFGNPPTSPSLRPLAESQVAAPTAAAAPQMPFQPRPQLWQQPRSRFGAQNDMPFPNGMSEDPRRMWSPSLTVDSSSADEAERPDVSPHLISHQRSPPSKSIQLFPLDASHAFASDGGTFSPPMPTKVQVPKRIRSPPLPSANVSLADEMNTEREMQAKAKRLARFHVELSQPEENPAVFLRKTSLGSENNHTQPKKIEFPVARKTGDSFDGGPSDYEGSESCPAICGLCPDMCPESEREERERKGDLDKYERLDGERNQTSISLAVKKYTRTADRDADLIRPLPVLQKTVDYLLDLLNQSYDDQFLGLYNFLWDRMRAIRMDLRMQHIFNHDAVHMLEQMIRLHIIAMHELSENEKGEGFSEGFDAHLNIEQMNKTSVELFQMYDDHRKKGSVIPTEKEFRGYYALLKLDKHPGYKVEPAELSLDLAKMTPEIRCTPEILFARDVARACRTSNFIAFFRLARKATYLQACLMHAHFSKLRTQALASLHNGLQNNQGIPVGQVVKWLAMEGEDIESLLEYHGFSTKRFEELFMVKEGPFLNSDVDYPTKCSKLVKSKRSKSIVDDVCDGQMLLSPAEEKKPLWVLPETFEQKNVENDAIEACVDAADSKMLNSEVDYSSSRVMQPQMIIEEPLPTCLDNDVEDKMGDAHKSGVLDVAAKGSLYHHSPRSNDELLFEHGKDNLVKEIAASNVSERLMEVEVPGRSKSLFAIENSVDEQTVTTYKDGGPLTQTLHEDDEVSRARLKLILRIWKRWSSKKREMREWRQSLADEALSSLSLGPPIRQNEALNHASGDLNIDYVVRERYARQGKSWSRLNISEVVAPILSARNPLAKCLVWKLALCLQTNDTGSKDYQLVFSWLVWKLMGTGRGNDDEHVIYSSNLSVWKKLLHSQVEAGSRESWCYSVIREVVINNNVPVTLDGTLVGLSAVVFLVSESIPWAIQKIRLEKIVTSIPYGSSLPLLILSSDAYRNIPDPHALIVNGLGLQYLDKTVVSTFSIVFLDGRCPPNHTSWFFSDEHLKGGFRWLAENSPLQPDLCWIKTRDLILNFLNSSLTALRNLKFSEVGPDHCITIFNEALERSTEEIRFAADMNKNHWPAPEVDLLKDLPYDSHVVSMLPSRDWSDAGRIEPLIAAIGSCKLPSFPNNLSWLNQGFSGGSDITNQKLALEQCLFGYLTDTVGLVGGNLAAKEASVMLQKGTGLELRGKHYYIIPRWLLIFRRIYHWRLSSLSSGKFSSIYVLERGIPGLAEPSPSSDMRRHSMTDVELTGLEDSLAPQFQQLHSALTQLSLDELIEISCSIPSARQYTLVNKTGQTPEGSLLYIVPNTEASPHKSGDLRHSDTPDDQEISSSAEQNKEAKPMDGGQMVDKLNALLEKCNRQQNMNDEKLAIYF